MKSILTHQVHKAISIEERLPVPIPAGIAYHIMTNGEMPRKSVYRVNVDSSPAGNPLLSLARCQMSS